MTSIPGRFGAVLTAMATPFTADGGLDVDGAVTLARWLIENGSDGLVVTGTTGESPVLSVGEKRDLWKAVVDGVDAPVVAGSCTYDTAESVELTKVAEKAGAAGILAVTPYYSRPGQQGLDAHFRAVAAATSLPVLLYDIPVRTGRKLAHETLVDLAAGVPNIAGVKDAASDVAATSELIAATPDDFDVYSGEDKLTLPLLSVGACGVIGVATHWSGRLHAEMLAAFAKGDIDAAREINARLLPSFRFESSDAAPNPIPVKAMLHVLGLPGGECRLPLGPPPPGLIDDARSVLRSLGEDAPRAIG